MTRRTEGERQRRRDLADAATSHMGRLLPWPNEGGNPCYLSTSADGSGYLSRLADDMEAVQLGIGDDMAEHARAVLSNPQTTHGELRYLAGRLLECLVDALRAAESRGDRLPDPEHDGTDAGAGAWR